MRGKTKRSKKVKELLYSSFQANEATRFGTDMEATAKEQYITYQHNNNHPDLSVQNCGLLCLTTTIGSEHLQMALCKIPVIQTNHLDFLK